MYKLHKKNYYLFIMKMSNSMRKISVNRVAQMGHYEYFLTIATNSDGSFLAVSSGNSSNIDIWDVATGRLFRKITLPERTTKRGFSADENYLAWCSLAFSDDGYFLAVNCWASGDIFVYTFEGEFVFSIKGDAYFKKTACFLPRSWYLVVPTAGIALDIWDVSTQRMVSHLPYIKQNKFSLATHGTPFYRTFCSPDGSQIVLKSTLAGKFVYIWDVEQENGRVHTVQQRSFVWKEDVCSEPTRFLPYSNHLYHIGIKHIEGYDTHTGLLVQKFSGRGEPPTSFCFSADGSLLFFSDMEGIISMLDVQTETLLFQFHAVEAMDYPYEPYESRISDMIWLPQSDVLATAGYKTADPSGIFTVTLWRLK